MSELNVKSAKRMRCMSHEFWSESSADFNANWKYLKKGSEWLERPMKFDTDLFQKVFFETFEILLVHVFC